MHKCVCLISTVLCCCLVLASCAGPSPATPSVSHISTTATPSEKTVSRPTPTATKPTAAPVAYDSHILLSGGARPDDMTFDTKGNLLFSDFYSGTISRLNADGSITVLQRNLAGPEGIIMLPDGTLVIAEQSTNRILSLAPGTATPIVLRTLPGIPSTAHCKDGVDGIAFDPLTNMLIIPDSSAGTVYGLSTDGKTMTLLASGIIRPVGAAIDVRGNIFIADECGGMLWRIAPDGKRLSMGSFGMLDDVVLDHHGNILLTDLKPDIHALIRVNLTTSKREILYSMGLIEPQGLVIDDHDNIYLSDDYANIIVKLSPRG